MAARHLQRLRALQEAEQQETGPTQALHDAESEEGSSSDDEAGPASAAPFNPFDLLDEEDDQPEEDQDGEEEEQQVQPPPQPQPQATGGSSKPDAGKGKGKNKKRKHKKKGQGGAVEADGVSTGVAKDDIDALVEQLNLTAARDAEGEEAAASSSTSRTVDKAPLLAVDAKKLRADDELRKIFGSRVVEADRAVQAVQRRRGVQPRGANRRRPAKKGYLITPKEHWPPVDGGLGMERIGIRNGQPLFRYTHSVAYASIQSAFKDMQETYNPNNIAALLQRHPFHVDTLLAMSDLYRYSGEVAYSEEMLERCLYALEAAWLPGFNPGATACQLDYMEENNRPMFTALFRHMMNKSRQGCHNTALECCKLLLAFDSSDPCGALMTIDYMALRASQYPFLQRFVEEWDGGQMSLVLMPNFAFSNALAAFRLEEEAAAGESDSAEPREATQGASSQERLIQAALLHPLVVVKVLEKLQEKGVGKDAWWGSILSRKLFTTAGDGGSASLAHLINIFAERQSLLWKPLEVLKWFRTAAEAAADIADGKREAQGARAEDWACVRSQLFPTSEKNDYRHLQVMDFSDTVNRIPPEELQAGMGGGMAVPEDMVGEIEAAYAAAMARERGRLGGANHLSDEEMQGANPLLMLLRSMLPWVDAGEEAPARAAPQRPAEEEG